MNLIEDLSSTRTIDELKTLLESIIIALSNLKEEDIINKLLFTRVKGEIENILVEREVNILLNSLSVQSLTERVDAARGIMYAA